MVSRDDLTQIFNNGGTNDSWQVTHSFQEFWAKFSKFLEIFQISLYELSELGTEAVFSLRKFQA